MSLFRHLAVAGVAALMIAAPAVAADAQVVVRQLPEPTPRAVELARRYVEATGQAHAVRMTTSLTSFSTTERLARATRPSLTKADEEALKAAFDRAAEAAVAREVEERARLHARYFTEAELEALLAPFDGPGGATISGKMLKLAIGDGAIERLHHAEFHTEALAVFCEDRPRQRICRQDRGSAEASEGSTLKQVWESSR